MDAAADSMGWKRSFSQLRHPQINLASFFFFLFFFFYFFFFLASFEVPAMDPFSFLKTQLRVNLKIQPRLTKIHPAPTTWYAPCLTLEMQNEQDRIPTSLN